MDRSLPPTPGLEPADLSIGDTVSYARSHENLLFEVAEVGVPVRSEAGSRADAVLNRSAGEADDNGAWLILGSS